MSWDKVVIGRPSGRAEDPVAVETDKQEWRAKGPQAAHMKAALDRLHRQGRIRDPGVYEPEAYLVSSGESLAKIAARLSSTNVIPFDGLDLAQYNWGTRKPPEINWYLHHFAGCVNSVGYNFIFTSPIPLPPALVFDKRPPEQIWVPRRKRRIKKKAPCARKKKNTVRPGRCPAQAGTLPDVRCCFPKSGKSGGSTDSPPCRMTPGSVTGDPITISEKWKDHTALINSIQKAQKLSLSFNLHRITDHAVLRGYQEPYQWFTQQLILDLVEEKKQEVITEKAKQGRARPTEPRDWPEEEDYLRNPEQLAAVARYAQVLLATGRLKGLTVRGYANRTEARSDNPVALSEARARFVARQLSEHYRLPLDQIEIRVIGCNSWFAPPLGSPEEANWQTVEVEVKDQSPEEGTRRVSRQRVLTWTYHSFDPGISEATPDIQYFRQSKDRVIPELQYYRESAGHMVFAQPEHFKQIRDNALYWVDALPDLFADEMDVQARNWLLDDETGAVKILAAIREFVETWQPPLDPRSGIAGPYRLGHAYRSKSGERITVVKGPEYYMTQQGDELIRKKFPKHLRDQEPSHTAEHILGLGLGKDLGAEVHQRITNLKNIPRQVPRKGLRVDFDKGMPPLPLPPPSHQPT